MRVKLVKFQNFKTQYTKPLVYQTLKPLNHRKGFETCMSLRIKVNFVSKKFYNISDSVSELKVD